MDYVIPKTKLTRGSLSGPTQLAVAILLMIPAACLICKWPIEGIPMSEVLGLLLVIATFRFMGRWQDYFNGSCHIFYCDKKMLAIRERPRKMHFVQPEGLERLGHDGSGYTFVLKNRRRFRMLHKDAEPQHSLMLKQWHANMQIAQQSTPDTSDPPTV